MRYPRFPRLLTLGLMVLAGSTGGLRAASAELMVEAEGDWNDVYWEQWNWNNVPVPCGLVPPGLKGVPGILAIAAGASHSMVLESGGTITAWGENTFGQLAIPNGLTGVTAIAAGYNHNLALKSDGTIVAWGNNQFGAIDVPAGLTGVTAISAGEYHGLALLANGTVVSWGNVGQHYNNNVPAGLSGVTAIVAGGEHSLALKSDGTVVAWGYSGYGATNVPLGLSGVVKIAAGYRHSLALKSDGTVAAWGWNTSGQSNVPAGVTNVTDIAGGYGCSIAIQGQGNGFSYWGSGNGGFSGLSRTLAQGALIKGIAAGGASHQMLWLSTQNIQAEKTKDEDPCPGCGGEGAGSNKSADPIFYATGEIDYHVDDISTSGFKPMSIRRSYSQMQTGLETDAFGKDWLSDVAPRILRRNSPYVEARLSATTSLIFTQVNNGGIISYVPLRHNLEQLLVTGDDLVLVDQVGSRILFHGIGADVSVLLRGKAKRIIDEGGNISDYQYDANGRLSSITRSGGGAQDALNFTYRRHDGLISNITFTIARGGAPAVVRSVNYSYYLGNVDEFGDASQLQQVEVRDASNNVLTRYHYRYWRQGETQPNTGTAAIRGKLKFVISTGAWARMVQAGEAPLTATNAVMGNYADKYWEYDSQSRVVRQTLRGNEVDGTGTQTFQYVTVLHPDGYNNWKTKTIETLADGTQNIVYCNYVAQVLVKITREASSPNREWVDAFRYDSAGREVWHATPAAITGYVSTTVEGDPFLGFGSTGNTSTFVKPADGLILERAYYSGTTATATTAGGSDGKLWKEMSRKGKNGTLETLRELKYITHVGN